MRLPSAENNSRPTPYGFRYGMWMNGTFDVIVIGADRPGWSRHCAPRTWVLARRWSHETSSAAWRPMTDLFPYERWLTQRGSSARRDSSDNMALR